MKSLSTLSMLLSVWTMESFARPSEAVLAAKVETQAEVAVGHTNFVPPPMSRFSILVQEASQSEGAAAALDGVAGGGEAGGLSFAGSKAAAAAAAKALTADGTALSSLMAFEGTPVGEAALQASESVQLLALALEKADGGNGAFLSLSAKGAIGSWNKLVNTLMDRMEQLYQESVPDVKQWEAIRSFLVDPKTQEFRGVLGSFTAP